MSTPEPTPAPSTSASSRRAVIDLLNEALSAEYNSFIGYALGSNPFVPPGCDSDVKALEAMREDENDNVRALLSQLGRYRAGPTLRAFRLWRHDLNFLGIDYLVIRAAKEAETDLARFERLCERVPGEDIELRATFESIRRTKERHKAELAKLAEKRQAERDAKRAAAHSVTGVKMKPPSMSAAAKPAAKAAPGGAPRAPGAPKAPPGAPKAPPGAPKAPPGAPRPPGSPPAPPGAPKPPSSAPKAPSPPAPPGAPKPPSSAPKAPSPPLPPGFKAPNAPTSAPKAPSSAPEAPTPPKPPASAPAAPTPPAGNDGEDAAEAEAEKPKAPPLPPGFKPPGK